MNQNDISILFADAATATTSYTSVPYVLNGVFKGSIQVKFSSAGLAGTLALQVSDDPLVATSPGTADWVTIPDSSQVIAAGASHFWNITDLDGRYLRFTWVPSAGTGTLTAWLKVNFFLN